MSQKATLGAKRRAGHEERRQRRAKIRRAALRTGRVKSQLGIGRRLRTRANMARLRKLAMSSKVPTQAATLKPAQAAQASRKGWLSVKLDKVRQWVTKGQKTKLPKPVC